MDCTSLHSERSSITLEVVMGEKSKGWLGKFSCIGSFTVVETVSNRIDDAA